MNAEHYGQHISHQFNEELEDVRRKMLATGGVVEEQLDGALAALIEGDSQRGEAVVANDRKVNELERDIDDECVRILARRQPLASDLRLLISVIKTIAELERMGDEAKRVARMAVEQGGRTDSQARFAELRHLGGHVRKMVHDALDAFARTDPEAALRVMQEDRRVDREYESIMRELITFMMEDPRAIPRALAVMWSARALERMGDRACNICEQVIFCAKGRDVRHVGLEQAARDARRASPAGGS